MHRIVLRVTSIGSSILFQQAEGKQEDWAGSNLPLLQTWLEGGGGKTCCFLLIHAALLSSLNMGKEAVAWYTEIFLQVLQYWATPGSNQVLAQACKLFIQEIPELCKL